MKEVNTIFLSSMVSCEENSGTGMALENICCIQQSLPLVPHPENCIVGHFVSRQKRFSVAVDIGVERIWIHSNNSGAMLGLLRPGMPVLLSPAVNPKRKLPFTQEAVWMPRLWPHKGWHAHAEAQENTVGQGLQTPFTSQDSAHYTDGFWVGVNTSTPNKMLEAAFHAKLLPFAKDYTHYKREAKRGDSRLDACLTCIDADGKNTLLPLWIECKNVTMVEDDVALFPDAATERGQKHLQELMDIVQKGERAAMFYLVQRADGHCFGPADVIDPAYARLFWQAVEMGVEVYAMRGVVRPEGIYLGAQLPLVGC